MTYLQTHKRPYERKRQIISALVVLIVISIFIIYTAAPKAFPTLFHTLAKPFWRIQFSLESGISDSTGSILNENESLKRQLEEMEIRLDTILSVESENLELKRLLDREGNSKPGILAAVLKRPPFSPYDELIIDIGRDYSLSTSSLVYTAGDVLIGRVVDVLSSTAKVRLFSSAGESYPVLIGPNKIAATAIGRGGGQYQTEVYRDAGVSEGDFVLNAGLSDKPFGKVSAIILDPTEAFKTILFAPPTNIYQLRWVLIK